VIRTQVQQVSVYVSSSAGGRLAEKPKIQFGQAAEASGTADIRIDDTARGQKMIGFGASFPEARMICINSLDWSQQEKVIRALFDPKRGAGFRAPVLSQPSADRGTIQVLPMFRDGLHPDSTLSNFRP